MPKIKINAWVIIDENLELISTESSTPLASEWYYFPGLPIFKKREEAIRLKRKIEDREINRYSYEGNLSVFPCEITISKGRSKN